MTTYLAHCIIAGEPRTLRIRADRYQAIGTRIHFTRRQAGDISETWVAILPRLETTHIETV